VLYGTIEYFLDQRQTTVEDELLQSLYNELEEHTEKTQFEIYPCFVLITMGVLHVGYLTNKPRLIPSLVVSGFSVGKSLRSFLALPFPSFPHF
jgi:hypothetical protein